MTYKLTKEERETVIIFNEASDMAILDTASLPMMRKMGKLCDEFPDVYKVVKTDGRGARYELPKNLITVRRPRKVEMTEEQRRAAADRLQGVRKKITKTLDTP